MKKIITVICVVLFIALALSLVSSILEFRERMDDINGGQSSTKPTPPVDDGNDQPEPSEPDEPSDPETPTEPDEECSHSYVNGACSSCGVACSCSYIDGVCTICGKVCSHSYSNGACSLCGAACSHTYSNGVCDYCGIPCVNFAIHSCSHRCSVCGYQSSHTYSNGVCTTCGPEGSLPEFPIPNEPSEPGEPIEPVAPVIKTVYFYCDCWYAGLYREYKLPSDLSELEYHTDSNECDEHFSYTYAYDITCPDCEKVFGSWVLIGYEKIS